MAARGVGRILTHSNVVPQLRALLSPRAIFPRRADADAKFDESAALPPDNDYNSSEFNDHFDQLGIPTSLPPPASPIGLNTSGELMCLDVGKRRTGVAVTQFVAGDVRAIRVLHHPPRRAGGEQRMRALQDDITYLEGAIAEHNIVGLVVGWPLEPHSGQPGIQCERVRSYLTRLQQAALLMSLSVGMLDENYGQVDNDDSGNCRTEALIDPGESVPAPNTASALASLDAYVWDERYSSKAVQSLARDRADSTSRRGKKKKKRRRKKQTHLAERQGSLIDNSDDDLAAAYILSEVVDALFVDEDEQWRKDMGF